MRAGHLCGTREYDRPHQNINHRHTDAKWSKGEEDVVNDFSKVQYDSGGAAGMAEGLVILWVRLIED